MSARSALSQGPPSMRKTARAITSIHPKMTLGPKSSSSPRGSHRAAARTRTEASHSPKQVTPPHTGRSLASSTRVRA